MPARRPVLSALATVAAALLLAPPLGAQPLGVPPIPPRRLETKPPPLASERYAWQPGHWEWDVMNARYVWHHGRQVARHPGTRRFVPGRWVLTGGEWTWRKAKWK